MESGKYPYDHLHPNMFTGIIMVNIGLVFVTDINNSGLQKDLGNE